MSRRPNGQPRFDTSANNAQATKKLNKQLRYVQGFRQALNNGNNTIPISLNSAGLFLLGMSVTPVTGGDITDCQVSLLVNNNNLLVDASAPNLNPQFVQGMIFFPTPQKLQGGRDIINVQIKKNDAGTVTVMVNIFYVPAI